MAFPVRGGRSRFAAHTAFLAGTLAVLALGCPGAQTPPPATVGDAARGDGGAAQASKTGLGFRLSDANGALEDSTPAPITKGTPLTKEQADRVLARLPALPADPSLEKSFALRAGSAPAPRTGKTVQEPFPPPPNNALPPNVTAAGDVRVLRHAPEGEVKIAPELSITFSQPMVPVTSHDDLAKNAPPVTLSPLPPGKWEWVGAETVLYRPEKRFPMATTYSVEIPAGTKSENGGNLSEAIKWTFTTPPPTLTSKYPTNGPTPTDQVVFLSFDQAIDPAAVLKATHMKVQGAARAIHLATQDEIEADATIRRMVEKAEAGRWMAFRADGALPTASSVDVQVGPGTPSAEGPLTTKTAESLNFATYGDMEMTGKHCGYDDKCTPLDSWNLSFSNSIDRKRFDKKMIHVSPDLPGMRIDTGGNDITISGRPHGRTTYKVTIEGTLPDVFGQTMGSVATAKFDVGSADPQLFVDNAQMQVLDPASSSKYTLYSINERELKVRLYSVHAEDYPSYLRWLNDWNDDGRMKTPPGREVLNTGLKPSGDKDDLVQTDVDLASALKDGAGQMILIAEPADQPTDKWRRTYLRVWLQATKLGLVASVDQTKMIGWASDLATGAPLAGVDISVLKSGVHGVTAADGTVRVDLGETGGPFIVGRKGSDVAILPEMYGGQNDRFMRSINASDTRWFTFDDRRMYKPGEEVKVKGVVRSLDRSEGGDVGLAKAGSAYTWLAVDARNAEIAHGTGTLDEAEQTDISFKLPDHVNLGQASVIFAMGNTPIDANSAYGNPRHTFQVQEFRRPEFEVNASTSDGDHVVGGHAEATVAATYYAGGGLPNAQVEWRVERSLGSFSPPNRSEYRFGDGTGDAFRWFGSRRGSPDQAGSSATWSGKTGSDGKHAVRVDFDSLPDAFPMSLAFTATVTDVNRQAWTATTSMLVHPADVYVGVTSSKGFVHSGDPLPIDAIAVDRDGNFVSDRPIDIELARISWDQNESGAYEATTTVVDKCHLASTTAAGHCSLKTTPDGGEYRVTATTQDATGRRNQTRFDVWSWGGNMPKDRRISADKLRVVPDKKSYAPGDDAELLIIAPFDDAEALVTVRRQGIIGVQRVTLKGRAGSVHVHLDDPMIPGVDVHVAAVGATPRDGDDGEPDPKAPKRPAFANESQFLTIAPVSRTLAVKVTPRDKKIEPGGSTSIAVEMKLPDGSPAVGAEFALMVADEAVLALTRATLPDPVAYFYGNRSSDTEDLELRDRVRLAEPRLAQGGSGRGRLEGATGGGAPGGGMYKGAPMPSMAAAAPMMDMAPPPPPSPAPMERNAPASQHTVGNGAPPPPIAMRTDFSALAAFIPHAVIGPDGKADLPLKLPDNLTRYRVMVVATHGTKLFGAEESTITARLPLMVRPSAPRFLNFGDVFELPIVIQNQTDAPMMVDVAARARNANIAGTGGVSVNVPANDRVEIRLPSSAARAGTAKFQVAASSEANAKVADASQFELPVWTPATTEAFATYGQIDDGAISQPLKMPSNVVTEFGNVEVTTSSTALQALTDAFLYIVHYPYECDEQISSRIMSIAALRDVLSAFQIAAMPSPEALNESMTKDFARLKLHQRYDGGWGYWALSEENPFVTLQVSNALARAKGKGYAAPADTIAKAQPYLANIESHIPSWYGVDTRRALVAYSLDVRARFGDFDRAKAKRLIDEAKGTDHLPLETLGWLLPVLSGDANSQTYVAQIRRTLENHVTETAGAAHFVTSYGDGDTVLLNSSHRGDGIILEAMIGDQPTSDLIPKVVQGLLASRKAGHWANTNEDTFVLLALDRYFGTYEKATPDFVARAWLGDGFAGDHTFKGRTTERSEIDIPMAAFAGVAAKSPNGQTDLVLSKTGPGRLYYRIGMSYAPSDLRPPPSDHGFAVKRGYEPIDAPTDVRKDPDGTWHIKAGAKVRVRVTMAARAERAHVALVDPLPAGLEAVNSALAVNAPTPEDPKARSASSPWWYWNWTWYEHQNLRDERVEAFASYLSAGVYDYSYVARATTPGTFVVPPPKAEEMYNPETFGRGAGDRVVIE